MIERKLKIIFMGTPDFAVPSLQILLEAGYPVVGVVTAPDKPGGRGMKQMLESPVKSFSIQQGLNVLQPENLKSKSFISELKNLQADLQVVVAFRMLPEIVWNMPPHGTMNLHASLLPAYRGAAPVNWAIINGESVTGLTTFLLQHEIDTGHIIAQREVPILDADDAGVLHDRMKFSGAGLVLGSVDKIASGTAKPFPQDDSQSSHAPKIDHELGHLDWNLSAIQVQNLIRGMSPYPGAWSILDGMEMKILKSQISDRMRDDLAGKISIDGRKLFIQAKDGKIELLEVQLAGKKRMSATDFINGYKIKDWQVT